MSDCGPALLVSALRGVDSPSLPRSEDVASEVPAWGGEGGQL